MSSLIRLILVVVLASTVALAGAAPVHADAIVHIVQWGETLWQISRNYGVSMEAIQAANGLTGTWLYAGQRLIIPTADSQTAVVASGGTHVVQPGETLFKIGLKYGLSWILIQQANNLPDTRIYAGQTLIIPSANAAPAPTPVPEATPTLEAPPPTETPTPEPTESAPASSGETIIHIVQPGDTLFKIGLKYGVRWPAIQAANGLVSTQIFVGQQLVIPGADDPIVASAVPTVNAPPPPAGTGRRFLVDLSEQRLYAFDGDTMVRTTLISSGTWRYPTVVGTFYIYLRYESARMRGPGYDLPNVPYVMYFYKGYGLHGTYWHNNFGAPMSHGCVNMPTEEAQWAYYWSNYGTPVIVQW
jgi:LysM repeat protein